MLVSSFPHPKKHLFQLSLEAQTIFSNPKKNIFPKKTLAEYVFLGLFGKSQAFWVPLDDGFSNCKRPWVFFRLQWLEAILTSVRPWAGPTLASTLAESRRSALPANHLFQRVLTEILVPKNSQKPSKKCDVYGLWTSVNLIFRKDILMCMKFYEPKYF